MPNSIFIYEKLFNLKKIGIMQEQKVLHDVNFIAILKAKNQNFQFTWQLPWIGSYL